MPRIREYITLETAAKRYNIPVSRLTDLVREGRIKAIKFNGQLGILEESVRKVKLGEFDPEKVWEEVKDLENKGIGIAEAARKYGIPQPTLSRWKKKGYIRVLGKSPYHKQKILLRESDVAFAAEVIKHVGFFVGKRRLAVTPPYLPQ